MKKKNLKMLKKLKMTARDLLKKMMPRKKKLLKLMMAKKMNPLGPMMLELAMPKIQKTKLPLTKRRKKILLICNWLGKCLNWPNQSFKNTQIPLKPCLQFVWNLNQN